MSSIISSHNLNVINPYKKQTYSCNCRVKESCLLQNQCLTPKIIYRTDIEYNINSETKLCFALTEKPSKERFWKLGRDFKHKAYSKSIKLSKYIWDLKEAGINPIVKWSIVEKISCNTKISYCKLGVLEKLYIIDFIDVIRLLNKRNELISGCKHQKKVLLKNVKWHRHFLRNLNCFWQTHESIIFYW